MARRSVSLRSPANATNHSGPLLQRSASKRMDSYSNSSSILGNSGQGGRRSFECTNSLRSELLLRSASVRSNSSISQRTDASLLFNPIFEEETLEDNALCRAPWDEIEYGLKFISDERLKGLSQQLSRINYLLQFVILQSTLLYPSDYGLHGKKCKMQGIRGIREKITNEEEILKIYKEIFFMEKSLLEATVNMLLNEKNRNSAEVVEGLGGLRDTVIRHWAWLYDRFSEKRCM